MPPAVPPLTIAQAAAALTVSQSTLRRLIADGELRFIRLSPGSVRIEQQTIDEYREKERRRTAHEETLTQYDTLPSGLKTAEEASAKTHISAQRLRDLADAGLCPHWRVDNGEPLFVVAEVRKWAARTMLQRFEGTETLNVTIAVLPRSATSARPQQLMHIDALLELPPDPGPGVYFLCHLGVVVYIGQSTSALTRLQEHRRAGKTHDTVFFLPCPRSDLDRVESIMIHAIQPALNGRMPNGELCAPITRERLLGASETNLLTAFERIGEIIACDDDGVVSGSPPCS